MIPNSAVTGSLLAAAGVPAGESTALSAGSTVTTHHFVLVAECPHCFSDLEFTHDDSEILCSRCGSRYLIDWESGYPICGFSKV